MTPDLERAVERGLAFLARRQITRGGGKGSFGTAGYSGGVAVCALSGLAFMTGGNPPGRGPYGKHVDRCVEFLVKNTNQQGYIAAPGGGRDRMYGHGFATLFLAEAYGMSMHQDQDSELGKTVRSAVKLIVDTQNDAGGWRYQPVKGDADLSITICQIMALRAARDAGIHVPERTRSLCIDYVKKSQNADGSFRYQVSSGRSGSFPLTAAGIVALNSAGIYTGPEIERALNCMMRYIPSGSMHDHYYFYGHYYAAQAAWHAGGDYWRKWFRAVRDTLLKNQRDNGSWIDPTVGAEFGTAMACIILQLPNNYLPIFAEG
jgi:prenyltransferase beta subunit